MYQLLASGNQQHEEERGWMLHLLAAGLQGNQDAQMYRSVGLHLFIRMYIYICIHIHKSICYICIS